MPPDRVVTGLWLKDRLAERDRPDEARRREIARNPSMPEPCPDGRSLIGPNFTGGALVIEKFT